jgi:hypothetical protein
MGCQAISTSVPVRLKPEVAGIHYILPARSQDTSYGDDRGFGSPRDDEEGFVKYSRGL